MLCASVTSALPCHPLSTLVPQPVQLPSPPEGDQLDVRPDLPLSLTPVPPDRRPRSAEGGRLQRELEYVRSSLGQGAGSLHQIVVQTPRDGGSVLRPAALLAHLEVIQAASQVSVDMFDM